MVADSCAKRNMLFMREKNDVIDMSISLSPIFPSMTNDMHVSIATSLHQSCP
jgi:hypothetical protein